MIPCSPILSLRQVGLNNINFFVRTCAYQIRFFQFLYSLLFKIYSSESNDMKIILLTRLEKVYLRKFHSLAKVIGTVITVSGAMVMTLYKGPAFQIIKGGGAIGHHSNSSSNTTEPSDQHWVVGTVMLISSCASWAGFFILQVSIAATSNSCTNEKLLYGLKLYIWTNLHLICNHIKMN